MIKVSTGEKFGKFGLKLTVFSTFLFLYLPMIVLVIFSFNTKAFPARWESFTLSWYQELFNSHELWASFANSLFVALFTTFLSLSMSVMLIYFASTGGSIKRYIPLFYGNIMIPETVLAVGLLSYFALLNIPLGLSTIIIAHTVLGLGFTIPIVYTRYLELDKKLQEASLVLGATPLQTFFKITLPLLRPTLTALGLLIFVISFDDFVLSYFCSGTSAQTLSIYLVSALRFGISPVVNALSSLMLIITTILVVCLFSSKAKTRIF